jgi:hypothetical protein
MKTTTLEEQYIDKKVISLSGKRDYLDIEYGEVYLYSPTSNAVLVRSNKTNHDVFTISSDINKDNINKFYSWLLTNEILYLEKDISIVVPITENIMMFYNVGHEIPIVSHSSGNHGPTWSVGSNLIKNTESVLLTRQNFYLKYAFFDYFVRKYCQ